MADRSPLPENSFAGRGLACRRGERLVFAGLDFSLPAAGALVLTGANGSGKSSLLRLMAGLSPPAEGTLAWDGISVAEDPDAHRARVVLVGHADALKPQMTVAETIAFWSGMRGADLDLAEEALERYRLKSLADLPCRLLSAGQRRRLGLARAVASAAELWLLDEPLTGLDEDAIGDLVDAIAAHRQGGGRVVLSTHAPIALGPHEELRLGEFRAIRDELALA